MWGQPTKELKAFLNAVIINHKRHQTECADGTVWAIGDMNIIAWHQDTNISRKWGHSSIACHSG